jgi:hypothetical protein
VTRYVEHVADAWAEFWSSDDERAATILYARTTEWWDVRRGRATDVKGRGAVLDVRRAWRAHAERFAVHVTRLVPDEDAVAVEFVAVASECGAPVATPGCAWWQLDDDGRIVREHWFWDWRARAPAESSLAGHVVRGSGGQRDGPWYRAFVHDVLETWDRSPPEMVDAFYADAVVFDEMGTGPEGVIRGATALRAAEALLAERLVDRRSTIGDVAGAGPLVGCTHFTVARALDGPRRTTPIARVWTLDDDDRIVSDHAYLLPAWTPAGGRRTFRG